MSFSVENIWWLSGQTYCVNEKKKKEGVLIFEFHKWFIIVLCHVDYILSVSLLFFDDSPCFNVDELVITVECAVKKWQKVTLRCDFRNIRIQVEKDHLLTGCMNSKTYFYLSRFCVFTINCRNRSLILRWSGEYIDGIDLTMLFTLLSDLYLVRAVLNI